MCRRPCSERSSQNLSFSDEEIEENAEGLGKKLSAGDAILAGDIITFNCPFLWMCQHSPDIDQKNVEGFSYTHGLRYVHLQFPADWPVRCQHMQRRRLQAEEKGFRLNPPILHTLNLYLSPVW